LAAATHRAMCGPSGPEQNKKTPSTGDAADKAPTKSLGERNYEQFADRYAQHAAYKAYNAHYDRPNTLAALPDVAGLAVLDAGCGPGFYAEELLARGARRVVAVDVTPAFVAMTKERCPAAEVHRADLESPEKLARCVPESDAFDVVVCALVLDYVDDLAAVYREFHRVLKPDGVLVFSVGHPFCDWKMLERKLPDEAKSYFDTQLFTCAWAGFGEPHPSIASYRRPLSAFLNPLVADACGGLFRLESFIEPLPPASMLEAGYKREFDRLSRDPGFMVVRARKR